MKLISTRVDHTASEVSLVGTVQEQTSGQRFELFFSYPRDLTSFVRDTADPFVPALLLPCLLSGEDLEIVPPVSPMLLRRLPRIQDILVSWHAPFQRVKVTCHERAVDGDRAGNAVGALFSGGVDSFYTLLKSLRGWPSETPRITHLVYLRGLETPLTLSRGVDESQRRVEAVAREVGLGLIVGRSNIRDLFTLNYERYYHGAALASAALALCGGLRYLLVPSSNSYAQLRPWGSDPMLDPLWSTELLEVVHDGSEARRVDKLQNLVAREPLALRNLRVCLENDGGAYNCGRCRKCIRTMTALALLGALGEARMFPDQLPDDAELLLREDNERLEKHAVELLDLARRTASRPDLTRLLERVIRRRRRRRAIRDLAENTRVFDRLFGLADRLRKRLRQARGGAPLAPQAGPSNGAAPAACPLGAQTRSAR